MMNKEDIEIGDLVECNGNDGRIVSYYKGFAIIKEIKYKNNDIYYFGHWKSSVIEAINYNDNDRYGFNSTAQCLFTILKKHADKKTCSCDLFCSGCNCGVFKTEMESSGRVYNKYIKLWE